MSGKRPPRKLTRKVAEAFLKSVTSGPEEKPRKAKPAPPRASKPVRAAGPTRAPAREQKPARVSAPVPAPPSPPPLCTAPWSHIYIDNDGWVYLCCRTERPESAHTKEEWELKRFFDQFAFMSPDVYAPKDESNQWIRNIHEGVEKAGDAYDKDTLKQLHLLAGRHRGLSRPIGNIRLHTIEEMWRSDYMEEIRQSFLKQEFPDKQCWRCQWELDHGVEAPAVLLSQFNTSYPWRDVWNDYKGGPKYINMHLGNLCNLKCVMCNEKYSSRHAGGRVLDPYTGNTKFEKSFEKNVRNLRQLNFGGGEPLINENMYRYLDLVNAARVPCDISYVTNMTTLTKRFLALLPSLYRNNFSVSIDGVGTNYESIRQGARWETVLRNLTELATHKEKYRIRFMQVKMCVFPSNYLDIEPLLNICKELEIVLDFNLVYYPEALSPFKSPAPVREKIRSDLEHLYRRRKDDIDRVCDNFQALSVI